LKSRILAVAAVAATSLFAAVPANAASSRYIVVLEKGSSLTPGKAAARARADGARVGFVYRHALRGYSATLSDAAVDELRASAHVKSVLADQKLQLSATQASPPSYGIDRVDQRALPLNQSYTYNATGAGVKAYIIDTGIRLSHTDFGGRAITGVDLIDGGAVNDCQGHGTHVAGTVGGARFGVAKGATLVGVRIGDCTTSINVSTAIAGIDWVTGDHQPGQPAVANMSFGGGSNSAMDTAVRNMIADGVSAAIAAGNGNVLGQPIDACGQSPARVAEALTTGATGSTDRKSSYSNYGTCLDVFAPGDSIVSASYSSDTGSASMSGTSMAAPHVAGAAALWLEGHPSDSPAAVATALTGNATSGAVISPGAGSPNRLLYTAFITAGGGGANQPPAASFANSCTDLACTFTDTSTDADGTIASRSWNFGDGTTSTAANPSKTYAAAGTYTVTLTVTDNSGATSSSARAITVTAAGGGTDPDPSTPTLTSGVARSASNGAAGTWQYYKIQVPAGRGSLSVVLDGPACGLLSCSPDLDLFARRATKPTLTARDCAAETGSSDETCTVSNPAGDWYYIGVYVYSGASGAAYTIRATY
jgi:PKD repeat protein